VEVRTTGLTVLQLVTVIAAVRGARSWPGRNAAESRSALQSTKRVAAFLVRSSLVGGLCAPAILSMMNSMRTGHAPDVTKAAGVAVLPDTRLPSLAVVHAPATLPASSDAEHRIRKQRSLTDALIKPQEDPITAGLSALSAQQTGTDGTTYESMYMRELEKTRARLALEEAEFQARLEAERRWRLQGLQ
jgi:hypothetical protein